MCEAQQAIASDPQLAKRFRDWFADHLGVDEDRKQLLYEDLSSAAKLQDVTYWLQILFSAGIATLGLVLNSPAVIIGAMLISPLMGPILSAGLSLATGDFILGLRAVTNLALSCVFAIIFAVLLVGLLPFKEMTDEISVRTQPTTLDLVVALFSGAIGSIASCKQVKGVVTSIPGVAIAVALMPPLCVTGYGIGYAFSVSGAEGMRVARGGGLLFLTNLVAITFTAMIVFLALHIDTPSVRQRIEEWRAGDPESEWFRNTLKRLHVSRQIRSIGSLPGRFLMIALPILVILIPLAQSFNQLRGEIARKQEENKVRKAAIALWQQNFGKLADGRQRSFMDQLSVAQQDGKIGLQLRVFTSKPLSSEERSHYTRLVAAHLNRTPDSMAVQFVEIPTTSEDLFTKAREDRHVETPPSVTQLQASFAKGVHSALTGLRLPAPAQMVDYQVSTGSVEPLRIDISYLSNRDIDPDATALIIDDVRSRLDYPTAQISLTRVEDSFGPLKFSRNQTTLVTSAASLLDRVGQILKQHRGLSLVILPATEEGERDGISDERATAIGNYLVTKWEAAQSNIAVEKVSEPLKELPGTRLKLKVAESLKVGV